MQDRTYIEESLESARSRLQPGERILTVGRTIYTMGGPYSRGALIAMGITFVATAVCLYLSSLPHLSEIFSVCFLCCMVVLLLFLIYLVLAPLLYLCIRTAMSPIEEICIITNQRVLTVQSESCTLKVLAKKADIAKIQSERGQLSLVMHSGCKIQMNVIEGLSLMELPTL